MKLARGNAGATTQDIMTVDAAGRVAFPRDPYILERITGNATFTAAAWSKMPFNTSEVALGGVTFDNTNNRFVAPVAGFYLFNLFLVTNSSVNIGARLTLNGATYVATVCKADAGNPAITVSGMIYMNGTTDFVEAWGLSDVAGSIAMASAKLAISLLRKD
jgi:hypothetical protein